MLVEVKVPILAESVAEATLMNWHKKVGEAVNRGDSLIDIETDKVTLEVAAPDNGVLKEILKQDGEDVTSDEVIARIDTEAGQTERQAADRASAETATAEIAAPEVASSKPETDQQNMPVAEKVVAGEPRLSPAVRVLLQQHNLNAADIPAQDGSGRLTKDDVLRYIQSSKPVETKKTEAPSQSKPAQPEPAVEKKPSPKPAAAKSTVSTVTAPVTASGGNRPEKRVAMSRLRRRAAERLLQAQHENAILSTFNEVNMQPVIELRQRYKEEFEKTHGVKLGLMSFFTKATVEALKKFPIINASIDGEDIIYYEFYDIGIAVSTPRGLVVPVLRDAESLSFANIEKTIREYGEKARDGKLTIDDLTGGTFTVTNGGVFGSLLSTPIINPPQSAILGMHKMQERPVAESGQVVIRPMMYIALSYDHRIIDGRDAVQFLVAIKEQIEDPTRLLLQV